MSMFEKFPSSSVQSNKKPEPTAETGKEFVFRLRNGMEVGRARTLSDFTAKIKSVPIESLEYHVAGKHFSPWLRYLKLNDLANFMDNLKSKGERLRQDILDSITKFWLG